MALFLTIPTQTSIGSSQGTLEVTTKAIDTALVYVMGATNDPNKGKKGSPFPWLTHSLRDQYLRGKSPLSIDLDSGEYLVGIQIDLVPADSAYRFARVGWGAFWNDKEKEFGIFNREKLGPVIFENSHRYSAKVDVKDTDPYKDDGYYGTYVYHANDKILYFRLYKVLVESGEKVVLQSNFTLKEKLPALTDVEEPSGTFSGFDGKFPFVRANDLSPY